MNKTKYLIALSIALFWACSDSPNEAGTTEIDNTVAQSDSSSSIAPDTGNSSSSVGGKQPSSSEPQSSSSIKEKPSKAFAADTKNGIKLGSCISTLARRTFLAADIDAASEELPEAYILNDGEGHYQVMLLNVNDYCAFDADLSTKRSGDTLDIEYGDLKHVTKCMCNSDHWFDIEAKNNDIEFVRFSGKTYEVSNKPAPEPSAIKNDSTAAQNDTSSTQNDSTATQADSTAAQDSSTFTDPRDGKTYRTVKLGERIWMAENLNYEIKDSLVSNCDENGGCDMGFPTNRPQSWCNGNKQENCDKYGRLYNLEAAKVACPSGWSLPTVEEWPERGNGGYPAFVDYAVVGWGGGKDTYGFSILSAGNYSAASQYFHEPGGTTTFFWTSTIDTRNNDCATMVHFGNGSEGMVSVCANDESDGLSVRCLKD